MEEVRQIYKLFVWRKSTWLKNRIHETRRGAAPYGNAKMGDGKPVIPSDGMRERANRYKNRYTAQHKKKCAKSYNKYART